MENFIELGYIGLFLASFLAATVLPMSSEVVFVALLATGFNPTACIIIASAGNVAGGATCYAMGYWGKSAQIEKYLGIKKEKVDSFILRVQKKGVIAAFFTFLPVIGDIIAVCLGYLRTKPLPTFLLMFLGKFIRYMLLYKAFKLI